MIKMVVFLGNPGIQYSKTRHNVGWLLQNYIDSTVQKNEKFKSYYYKEDGVTYLLPQTFMNKSGEAVVKAASFFKIDISEILVVHDELETDFGTFKIKDGGGLAGHNGLKSIKEKIGSNVFKRLAIGISRPQRGSVANYVLERFTPQEEAELDLIFDSAQKELKNLLQSSSQNINKKVIVLDNKRGKR